jgi:hypothetical protein
MTQQNTALLPALITKHKARIVWSAFSNYRLQQQSDNQLTIKIPI